MSALLYFLNSFLSQISLLLSEQQEGDTASLIPTIGRSQLLMPLSFVLVRSAKHRRETLRLHRMSLRKPRLFGGDTLMPVRLKGILKHDLVRY